MKDFVDHVAELWQAERPDLDLDAPCALDRLLRIGQVFTKEADRLCRAEGVSFWAFAVLAALRRAGPPYQLSPTALYRSGMVTSGAITKRVGELESLGLVRRVPDPRDRRSRLVRLTPRGRRLIDRLVPAYLELQREAMSALPRGDQRQLAALLRAVLLTLEGPALPARSA